MSLVTSGPRQHRAGSGRGAGSGGGADLLGLNELLGDLTVKAEGKEDFLRTRIGGSGSATSRPQNNPFTSISATSGSSSAPSAVALLAGPPNGTRIINPFEDLLTGPSLSMSVPQSQPRITASLPQIPSSASIVSLRSPSEPALWPQVPQVPLSSPPLKSQPESTINSSLRSQLHQENSHNTVPQGWESFSALPLAVHPAEGDFSPQVTGRINVASHLKGAGVGVLHRAGSTPIHTSPHLQHQSLSFSPSLAGPSEGVKKAEISPQQGISPHGIRPFRDMSASASEIDAMCINLINQHGKCSSCHAPALGLAEAISQLRLLFVGMHREHGAEIKAFKKARQSSVLPVSLVSSGVVEYYQCDMERDIDYD